MGATVPIALAGCSGDGSDSPAETDAPTETDGSESTPTSTSSSGSSDVTLNVGQRLEPTRLDPIMAFSLPGALVGNRIFSKFYTYDEGTGTVPNVAAADPEVTRDGTRWTVPIRDDVTFHNGDPLTAEDVKYSFLAPIEEETGLNAVFKVIDSIETVDENTVQFDLQFPYAMFDDVLTHHIVPKSVREEDKEAFNKNPVGSGPFEFVEWVEKEHVAVERWDDYWKDELPNVAGVTFSSVTENTTRVTTLNTGKQDIIQTIPPKLWNTVEQMGNASISSAISIGYYYVAFNINEGPTQDIDARQGIDYSFSMDDAVSNFIEPTGTRQYGPLPDPIVEDWGFPVEEWKDHANQKDIDQAKSLLDRSDVPDDWNCTIIVPPDDNRENIGVSIANGIQEAGYNANVQRYDWGTFLNMAYEGNADDYNLYVLGWVRYPDPDDFIYNLFHEESEGVYQGHYYKNDEVMDQIAQARQTTDRATRKELYTSAIDTVLADKVHLPSFNYKNSYGVRDYVGDFQTHPVAPINPRLATDYNNVTVDK